MSAATIDLDEKRRQALVEKARRRVVLVTMKRGVSYADAEDIAQEAMTKLIVEGRARGGEEWDGVEDPFRILSSMARNILWTRRRRDKKAPELDYDVDAAAPSSRVPDRRLDMERKRSGLRRALEALGAKDATCAAVLALFDEGVDGREEQAARLGEPVSKIKGVRERIKYAGERWRRGLDEESEP